MKKVRTYEDSVHFTGRVWILSCAALMLMFPAAICVYFNAWPPITGILKGCLSVVPIFWTVGTIEVFTYVPMMGAAGSYLGFVTNPDFCYNSYDRTGKGHGKGGRYKIFLFCRVCHNSDNFRICGTYYKSRIIMAVF